MALQIRNPGPYSFGLFLASAALVVYFTRTGIPIPEALKYAGEILALAAATFAGKSAVVVNVQRRKTDPPPKGDGDATKNPNLRTWPDVDPPPTIDVELVDEEKTKPSIYAPARKDGDR